MLRKWLRQCQLFFALLCLGVSTTVWGQDDAAQPPAATETPAATPTTETPATETPATETPAKDAAPPKPKADTEPTATEPPAETAPTENAPPAATPAADAATTPDAAAKGATAAPVANPAAAQAAFAAKMDEWKTVLKSLRALVPRYALAEEKDAEAIRTQWNDLIAKGESLIPELRATGKVAYASGRGDRVVERFLIKLLSDDMASDRFEPAYDLGTSLVSSGCDVKEVLDATGVAAFAVNDFEGAEKYLKQAQEAGSLSETGQQNLAMVDEYKVHWEKEKALREKEAAADDLPRVKITTNRGEIIVELLENEAPDTVGNFVSLVSSSFYDNLTFHRVLPAFMAQGGCPQGNGSGGPGYEIKCETDAENHRMHFRGTLSMAHRGKDTGGSQFFLTFVPTAHLNGKHTVFGRVIEGMDVLAKLQRIDPQDPEETAEPDKIIKMEVVRKRDHEYKPNKS